MGDIALHLILLAGGQGTRLRPFTSTLPKPLVPIGDHSIIEILLHRLKKSGLRFRSCPVNLICQNEVGKNWTFLN